LRQLFEWQGHELGLENPVHKGKGLLVAIIAVHTVVPWIAEEELEILNKFLERAGIHCQGVGMKV
jgi:hypothetical protein